VHNVAVYLPGIDESAYASAYRKLTASRLYETVDAEKRYILQYKDRR